MLELWILQLLTWSQGGHSFVRRTWRHQWHFWASWVGVGIILRHLQAEGLSLPSDAPQGKFTGGSFMSSTCQSRCALHIQPKVGKMSKTMYFIPWTTGRGGLWFRVKGRQSGHPSICTIYSVQTGSRQRYGRGGEAQLRALSVTETQDGVLTLAAIFHDY